MSIHTGGASALKSLISRVVGPLAVASVVLPAAAQAQVGANPQQVSLENNIFGPPGETGLCQALNASPPTAGTDAADLLVRCNSIAGLVGAGQTAATQSAFQAIAGEEVVSQDAVIAGTVSPQNAAVAARLGALSSSQTIKTAKAMRYPRLVRVADASGNAGFDATSSLGSEFSAFLTGYFFTGNQDPTTLEDGFDFDGYTITGGIDKAITDKLVLGLAAGYTSSEIEIDNNDGELDGDTITLSGYALYRFTQALYASGLVSYSHIDYKSDRSVVYTESGGATVSRRAQAETDAHQISASLNSGYELVHNNVSYGPTIRATYIKQDVNGFTETGASGLNLKFNDQESESLTLGVGAQASTTMSQEFGILIPYVRGEWEHEFEDKARLIGVRFANDAITSDPFPITVLTNTKDKNRGRLGAGVAAQFANGWSGFVDYETVVGLRDVNSHVIAISVRKEL